MNKSEFRIKVECPVCAGPAVGVCSCRDTEKSLRKCYNACNGINPAAVPKMLKLLQRVLCAEDCFSGYTEVREVIALAEKQ